jgi:hypothetical protein
MPKSKDYQGVVYLHLTQAQMNQLAKIAETTGHTRAALLRQGAEYIIKRYQSKTKKRAVAQAG